MAKKIGTYELSTKVGELCNIAEGKVVTHASPERAEEEFKKLSRIEYQRIEYSGGEKKKIPEDAVVVDVDEVDGMELERDKFYVIECESGFRAELKAEELRKKGYKAVGRRRN